MKSEEEREILQDFFPKKHVIHSWSINRNISAMQARRRRKEKERTTNEMYNEFLFVCERANNTFRLVLYFHFLGGIYFSTLCCCFLTLK